MTANTAGVVLGLATLVPYYHANGLLVTMDGMNEVDRVTDELFRKIDGLGR